MVQWYIGSYSKRFAFNHNKNLQIYFLFIKRQANKKIKKKKRLSEDCRTPSRIKTAMCLYK